MKKFGLDSASVAATNPKLIYSSIRPMAARAIRLTYGVRSDHAGRKRLHVAERVCGWRAGADRSQIDDMATGMSACNAILLALIARDRLGRGQQVEVALIDTAVAMTGFYGMAYLVSGATRPPRKFAERLAHRRVFRHPMDHFTSPAPTTACTAGSWLMCSIGQTLSPIPVAHRKNRTANKEKLRAIIAGIFASNSLEHWMAKIKSRQPGYLRTVEEGFNAPEVRDRHRLSRIPHRPRALSPILKRRWNKLTPTVDPVAAPLLGEHTREVLRKTLGYDERRIADLAEAGAFGKRGQYGLNGADQV